MICYILILICVAEYLQKRFISSMIIFWFLLLDGFQIVPLVFLTMGFFSGSTKDGALLCFLILLIVRGRYWIESVVLDSSVRNAILTFLILLFLNAVYGYLHGYSFIDIFRGARLYLFLGSFLMFVEIPLKYIIKIIKILIVITFFQSLTFLMQVISGVSLLQGSTEALLMEDDNYVRFYNLPLLLDFALVISLFWFPFSFSKKIRYLFIGVFVLTLIAPIHRGYIFAWLLSIIISSLYFNSNERKVKYVTLITLISVGLLSLGVVRSRISQAIDQISVLSDVVSGNLIYESNTFLYRVNHIIERMNYVNLRPLGWLFGIGLIDDKAPQAQRLPLYYGLPDPVTGNLVKVYTADIVWSMLILTMGYVGAMLYLNIFIKVLYRYLKLNIDIKLKKVVFLFVSIGILTSFTGNLLLLPHFVLPCLLIVVIIGKYSEHGGIKY